MRRVRVLMAVAESDPMGQPWITALQQRFDSLGWQPGGNLRIDYRWTAGDLGRMPGLADELVSPNPDALLAGNNATAAALRTSMPELSSSAFDPIRASTMGLWLCCHNGLGGVVG